MRRGALEARRAGRCGGSAAGAGARGRASGALTASTAASRRAGVFANGPELFCGLDPNPDACAPQGQGGPLLVAGSFTIATGAVLLGLGIARMHQFRVAHRWLVGRDLSVVPVFGRRDGQSEGGMAMKMRF